MEVFVRMARPKNAAAIEQRVGKFWRSIEANEEPSPDYELDANTITRLYMEVTHEKAVDLSGHSRLPKMYAEYEALGATEWAAKRQRNGVRAQILEDAELATTDGWRVLSNDMARQARHFTVTGENFDGARKATVTVEPVGKDRWNMTIRPYRRRTSVTVSLGEMAARLLWQEARERVRKG